MPTIAATFGRAPLGKALDEKLCEARVVEISDSVQRNPGALISMARP